MRTVKTIENTAYYLTAALIFVLMRVGFTLSGDNDIAFLLIPTDKLVGLLTGSHSVFIENAGYFHEKLNIIIGKSCSGFNFLLLSFLAFAWLAVKYFNKPLRKFLNIPIALISACLLAVFVNASRILASVVLQNRIHLFFPGRLNLIHEAVGIITELTFLVLAYCLIENFLKQRGCHAKPA
jgi:exosortase K